MAGNNVTSNFSDWKFYKYHIQENVQGGQFINAESTLIAAGPPSLDAAGGAAGATGSGDPVYPIALLETFGLQQSRQLQRIFEIGSSRSYFVPGRTIGSISLGRTFYYGPSLLRVMYAYWNGTFDDGNGIGDASTSDGGAKLLEGTYENVPGSVRRTPGYGYMLIDLASDLFTKPTGLAIYFKDCLNNTFGGFYLEYCYVQGHQMTVSSGSVLIMEGVSVQYDLLVPMDIGPAKA